MAELPASAPSGRNRQVGPFHQAWHLVSVDNNLKLLQFLSAVLDFRDVGAGSADNHLRGNTRHRFISQPVEHPKDSSAGIGSPERDEETQFSVGGFSLRASWNEEFLAQHSVTCTQERGCVRGKLVLQFLGSDVLVNK